LKNGDMGWECVMGKSGLYDRY